MKKLFTTLLAVVAICATAFGADADLKREHRAVWVTAFLKEWPSGALNSEGNVNRQVKNLRTQLDDFKANNINTIYFHVRSHCDALYKSTLEPWAACVGGTRGTAPLIDPLQTVIDECHARGIEVYAWVNPYRYAGNSMHGDGELNYETTHPEWLITRRSTDNETILNPGLPEVRQRITAVCKEIVEGYDIDGLIFDDYFYSTNTPMSADADLYNAYKNAGGSADQAAWRRNNVNMMIRDVRDMIVATKPYLNFAISPAGRCNPPDIANYGLPASGMGDWQYSGIHSDPVYWLSEGLIDMVSPQLYWSLDSTFGSDSSWWIMVCNHFNRNIAVSTSMQITDSGYKSDMFVAQQMWCRDLMQPGRSGLAYFSYGPMTSYRERDPDLGANKSLAHFLGKGCYQNKVLQVQRPWRNEVNPKMPSSVSFDGTDLKWTLAWECSTADRFTIYAIPEALAEGQFASQAEYLIDIVYNATTYAVPEAYRTGYKFAVSCYDRYGNEYAPLLQGATPGVAAVPTLVSPINGDNVIALGDFSWQSDAKRFIVEIANDNAAAAMTDIIATFETTEPRLPSAYVKILDDSKTYLWRVTASSPNALDATSAPQRFSPATMKITAPANNATNVAEKAHFTFSKAAPGAEYLLEIATTDKFSSLTYSNVFTDNDVTLPEMAISTGATYYARVTASLDGLSMTSSTVKFVTSTVEYTEAPKFVNPSESGQVMHCNQPIILAPWHGLTGVTIEVSESETFPARGATMTSTLTGFATETKELGEFKISNKALTDGKTYYLRARGRYSKNGNSTGYTPYTDVIRFVYSAEAGVQDINADATNAPVEYFNLQGIRVANPQGGIFIRRQGNEATKVLIK